MRQPNRYRVYSGEQVALLRAFARLCQAGERIGDLVRQPREEVLARAQGHLLDGSPLGSLLDVVQRLDRDRLGRLLAEHRQRLGPVRFGTEIVLPLGEVIGDFWALGRLSVAAEHLASEVIVQQLKHDLEARTTPGAILLAAGLPGERHEWGLLVTLTQLKSRGWRVQYLGTDLPLKDVIEAAWAVLPRVVALSAADRDTVTLRMRELRRLPRLLPPGVEVVVGGRGVDRNGARLRRAGLRIGTDSLSEPG